MHLRFLAFSCCLLFFGFQTGAQVLLLKSVDQALERGRKENTSIRQTKIQEEIAWRDQGLSRANLLPSLALNLNTDYNLKLPVQMIPAEIFGGTPGTFKQVRFGQNWNQAAAFDLNTPLLHPEKIAAARAAGKTREQAKHEQQLVTNQVLQKIASQYFQYLQCEELIRLNQMLDSAAARLFLSTRAMYEQQLVSIIDLNRVENLLSSNKLNSLNALSERKLALQGLMVLLNINPGDSIKVDDYLINYLDPTLQENTINPLNRPAYLAAEQFESAMRWKMRQNLYAGFPRLNFNARYSFSSQSNTLFDQAAARYEFGTLGLQLNIPILKGGSNYLQYRKARLQLNLADAKKSQALLESNAELNEWKIRLEEKREARKINARRNELALQNLNLSLKLYDEGVINLDQLFSVYNEFAQARNAFLKASTEAAIYQIYIRIETLRL